MSSNKVLEQRANGFAIVNRISPNHRLFVAMVEKQEDGSFLRTMSSPASPVMLSFADLEAVKEYYCIR